jgi:hypothetical protein
METIQETERQLQHLEQIRFKPDISSTLRTQFLINVVILSAWVCIIQY